MAEHASPSPDPATKEAQHYWGYLFRDDKCGTDLLNRLLEGIARYVAAHFDPAEDCADITPAQLAGFYRAVDGNYDPLFLDTPASSVAFIYKSLGCLHSLQPAADSDGYSIPTIPSLKRKGFVTWQTIQLLLGPDEHVPFLQNAVERFDIVDPVTGKVFPKILPKDAFPDKPDDDMLSWYDNVSNRLRRECEQDAEPGEPRPRPPGRPPGDRADRFESDFFSGDEGSPDERTAAAAYFRNPLYRNREGRPTIIRRFSRADYKPRSPREFVQDRGRMVASTLSRHIWTPWGRDKYRERRKSLSDRPSSGNYSDDAAGDYDDEDEAEPTPTGLHPRHAHHSRGTSSPRPPLPHRPRPGQRRGSSRSYNSATSSDSEDLARPSTRMPPNARHRPNHHVPLRHRRSHSPPSSPREYFPPYGDYSRPRRNSHQHPPGYPYAHVSPHRDPGRHSGSDPIRVGKEHREREDRHSPRQREHRRSHSRDRDYEPHRESARPSPRDHGIPSTSTTPPTPPPGKTYSGTDLPSMAGVPGNGTHPSPRPSPSGFKPTNEPLFATQVAHLQPPPPQMGPGGPGVPTPIGAAPSMPPPGQIPRSYYGPDPRDPRGSIPDHSRRPSYPQRGPSASAADRTPMPTRAQTVRYPGSASPRWGGSRNSSMERDPMGSRRDRAGAGHRYVQGVGGGVDGVGGRRYPVEGRY